MTAPIFYCEPEILEGLSAADRLVLDGSEGHHAKNVKRLQVGEPIDIADGRGRRIVGDVSVLLPQGLEVTVRESLSELPDPAICLVQALAKYDRDLLGIEVATELGVSKVIPWAAEHCVVRWKKERADKYYAKWSKTVTAAAKQARRAWIPQVASLHTSAQLAQVINNEENTTVLILHENAGEGLTQVFTNLLRREEAPQNIFVVIGPEGGISSHELKLFVEAGALPVKLGQEILRSSTAGAAALSAINTLVGRW